MDERLKERLSLLAQAHGLGDEVVSELSAWVSMMSLPEEAPAVRAPGDKPGHARYDFEVMLGRGGMGEVWRVHDRELRRDVALKIMRAWRGEDASLRARFEEEVQLSAQLTHPNIVPVHDHGQLEDGRLFYTMREVHGERLSERIRACHAQEEGAWTLRNLLEALLRASEAVAFAHARGVIHRDLKPANIMSGAAGEVYVVDWGLGRVMGGEGAPMTSWSEQDTRHTRPGAAAGTPRYMAPEQAMGQTHDADERADVWALGAILYEMLMGRAGFDGARLPMARPPVIPRDELSEDLAPLGKLCEQSFVFERQERLPHAGAFASQLRAWLDGAKQRERAREDLERARGYERERVALGPQIQALKQQAQQELDGIALWQPEQLKHAAWAREDRAQLLERRQRKLEFDALQTVRAALTHDANFLEAHLWLLRYHHGRHKLATHMRQPRASEEQERLMRLQLSRLPAQHPERVEVERYLEGSGLLSLQADTPGVRASIARYVERDRKLVLEEERELGELPLERVPLSMGSYMVTLTHPERERVSYPVFISRLHHWEATPPGQAQPVPVKMPERGSITQGSCYVPGGWFAAQGDELMEEHSHPLQLWVDDFVIDEHMVSNTEYIEFLDDLNAQGREQEIEAAMPRELGTHREKGGEPVYGRREDGTFLLKPDKDGDIWQPDWPVLMVDWFSALVYARWRSERDGLPWRLPGEWECEKAGRGVDGRTFAWGNFLDPSRVCMRDSHANGMGYPCSREAFEVDTSVYGMRHVNGLGSAWCFDLYTPELPDDRTHVVIYDPPLRLDDMVTSRCIRCSGVWFGVKRNSRMSLRTNNKPRSRYSYLGIRLARSL